MNKKEFEFILQEGEGLKIEFKESFDPKSLSKEIVAFANSEGGRIFIGVNDKGNIKGIKIDNRLKSQIQDVVRNCDSRIKIDLEEFGNILIVNVYEGEDKPYKCSSGFYLRQGPNSQKMTVSEIQEFFNKEGKILFDERINKNFSFRNGFDEHKFNSFLEKSKTSKVISIKSILNNIGVLDNKEQFRNAGVLFFCDRIEEFIPQAIVTCVLYKGKDKVFIIDKKDFAADIFSNYQDAVDFLYRNLKLKYEIKGFGPRKEILEIPEEALKEALVNALAHRDYSEKGANALVEIYDDRVEITNPGGLVSGIKKSEFGKKSLSRNPLLFSLFKRIDLVEKVGSGINRIRKAMKEAGLRPPKFEFTNFFTITFYRPKESMENREKIIDTGLTQELSDNEKNSEPLSEPLNEPLKKIFNLIKNRVNVNRTIIIDELGISRATATRYLSLLKKRDYIIFVGSKKRGYYQIKLPNKLPNKNEIYEK